METSKQLLIVGDNIVGLLSACLLVGKSQLSITLLAKDQSRQQKDQDVVLTPRSLEVFSHLGIDGEILQEATTISKVSVSTLEKQILSTDLHRLLTEKTKYKSFYVVKQGTIVKLLRNYLDSRKEKFAYLSVDQFKIIEENDGELLLSTANHSEGIKHEKRPEKLIVCEKNLETEKISKVQQKSQANVLKGFQKTAKVVFSQPAAQSAITVIVDSKEFAVIVPFGEGKAKLWSNSEQCLSLLKGKLQQVEIIEENEVKVENCYISSYKKRDTIFFVGEGAHLQPEICNSDLNMGIEEAFVLSRMLIANGEKNYQKYFFQSVKSRVERMTELTQKAFSLDITWTSKVLPLLTPIIKRKINKDIIPFFTGLSEELQQTPSPKL